MKLTFTCPHCDKVFNDVNLEMHGKRARCVCGEVVTIAVYARGYARPSSATETSGIILASSSNVEDDDQTEEHYEDLEQILESAYVADVAQVEPTEPTEPARPGGKTNSGWPSGKSASPSGVDDGTESENNRIPPARARLHFISGIVSAVTSLGLASMILLFSFWETEMFPFASSSRAFTALSSGNAGIGLDQVGPSLRYGLMTTGRLIGLLAIVLLGLSLAQLANAIFCHVRQRRLIRWIDGLVATGAVAMLFLLIAAVFVHSSQVMKQKRTLNRFDSAAAVVNQQSELPNVQRLREQYESLSREFNWVMGGCGLLALVTFGAAMTRKLTAPVLV